MSDLAEKLAKKVACEPGLRNQIADCLKCFQVDDLLCNKQNMKVVLLCESPHIHEVKAKYPLAGKSGRNVTEVLWEDVLCEPKSQIPKDSTGKVCAIGDLTKRKCTDFNWLGIMNVSTLPLQLDPYACSKYSPKPLQDVIPFVRILRDFDCIIDPDKSSKIGEGVGKIICDHLRYRLSDRCKEISDILFVLCGNVAQEYFSAAAKGLAYSAVCVPHPSRNQWRYPKYKECIALMCEKIKCALGYGSDK